MFYPLRRMRRKQALAYAKLRLRKQFFRITEKKQSHCLKQPRTIHHVRFTGKVQVITFDKGAPPVVSILRRPSRIDQLSDRALLAEAERLQIRPRRTVTEELKKRIASKWRSDYRSAMKQTGLDSTSVADKDIEDYYNLFLALKRSANLLLSGESFMPQRESLPSLIAFMRQYGLYVPPNPSRSECIQSVENYLVDHVTPRDSPLGDLSRCRLSATDFFNVKYALHSSAMLRDVLASYGLKAPKSLLQRKMAVADLLDKELKEAFTSCLRNTLDACLAYRKMECASSSPSVLMKALFDRMKEDGEPILEETE
ncbi:hypothetical protein AV274_0778 [Blastocystis sp. ATCC 50177/Nand II]|uniref:Uncharacterized protein n=1 Tax=Blastocystis sp. subtype 1 (strain ATCC 50177 / NandII) TaxID=478820 RepID=A0A196SMI0_BLAHN|nr:hypothetical protein AV274_0778 [Blastocystis sp. ATCC 50177/Nand II]